MFFFKFLLTPSWWKPFSYRNQSTYLLHKSTAWLLYDNGLRNERVKMGKKWRKMLSPTYSLKFKNIILFLNRGLYFFFQMLIFATLFRRCPTLKMKTLFRCCLTLFSWTLKNTTLFYVVNFNVDIHKVVSTLMWRCVTSRRHINLKTTLNRRWNVCWEPSQFL